MVSYILLYAAIMSLVIKLIEGAFEKDTSLNIDPETSKNETAGDY